MQKSIEVEYWVIDRDGELTEPGALAELSDNTEREFVECLFELKTPPCETMSELERTFVGQLSETLERARELGKGLVPLGTPVNGGRIEQLAGERADIQTAVVGESFSYAKYCAGTHVHFEQGNVVDQLNALIALDPALALCNSSPYFQGERIADGARAYLYRKKSYEEYPKHGQLWAYADTVAQWNRRLDRRFEEFRAAAADEGIDEAAVEEHFTRDDVVWTPVRLRSTFPTVEWRSPDATLPSQILRLVEDLERVMDHLHDATVRVGSDADDEVGTSDGELVLPEFETVRDLADAAMVDGLESDAVCAYLERMGFDVDEYQPLSGEIDDSEFVDESAACELRREYADRLEQDVEGLRRTLEAEAE
ncbi:glutamate-cysteine ligase family protein [Halobacteria archaeon AArc-m2/3/4]|uniref:Glutamate-cysteine ligase family protein n=1 Tax=Natronoglomus mannanivorans TaxID=2979990 RepID=A0ABT2Q9G8_9EURY|nr:glutamate-cysteine ligase family protein [Halobacteria archaeon AArc-m2/3/4]